MSPSIPPGVVETGVVRKRAVPLLLALLVATAGVPSSPAVAAENPSPHIAFLVQVDVGDGAVVKHTLRCSPTSGTHPNRWAACKVLLAGGVAVLKPVPADTMCTQVYGGAQKAVVTGTWNGKKVSAKFTRTDGCQISRWDAVKALFKVPGMTY